MTGAWRWRVAAVVGPRLHLARRGIHARDRPAEAHVRPRRRGQGQQRRIEPRAIEPDRAFAAGLGAVSQAERRPGRRLDSHRGDGSGDGPDGRLVQPGAAKRHERGRRREDAARVPTPLGHPLEDDDRATRLRDPGRQDGAGRPAADDDHVDLLWRRSFAGALWICVVAIVIGNAGVDRGHGVPQPERAAHDPDGHESGGAQQPADLARSIGAPDRERRVVSRISVAGQKVAEEPGTEPAQPAPIEVVDDDAESRDARHLGEQRRSRRRSRWCRTSEQWATSNERSG